MTLQTEHNTECPICTDSEYGDSPVATLDQTSGAVHYVRDNWGDYHYRLGYLGSDHWQVTHADGSRFVVLIDRYGNHYES